MRKMFVSKIMQNTLRTTCYSILCFAVPTIVFADDNLGLRGEIEEQGQSIVDATSVEDFTFYALRGLRAEPLRISRSPALRLFTHDDSWKQLDQEFKIRLDPVQTGSIDHDGEQDFANTTGLRGAVEASLTSSYELRIALKTAHISNTNIWKAIATFAPTLSASYSHSLSKASTALENTENSSAKLTLSVPVFTGGSRMFNLAAAKSSALSSHYSALATMDQVQLGTVQAYVQLASAQQSLAIYQSGLKHAKTLYNATQARQQSGFASASDVALVRANLAAAQRNVEQAKGGLQQAKIALKSRTGQKALSVAHDLNLHRHLKGGLLTLIDNARRNNPSLRAANANYRTQLHSTRASYGQFLPQVSLQGQFEHYLDKPYNGDAAGTGKWTAGIQVSVPLVNLANVANTYEQRQRTDLAILQEAQALHGMEADIKGLWANYTSLNAIVVEAAKESKARKHVFLSVSSQHKEGFTTLEALVDADQNAQNAALTALQLEAQRDVVAAQLLTLSGQFKLSMLRK